MHSNFWMATGAFLILDGYFNGAFLPIDDKRYMSPSRGSKVHPNFRWRIRQRLVSVSFLILFFHNLNFYKFIFQKYLSVQAIFV